MTDPIVVRCGCSRQFKMSEWLALPGRLQAIGDGGPDLRLSECPDCGSTRAIYVDAAGNPIVSEAA